MNSNEYVYTEKGGINHGFSTGEISTGEMYFTKKYIFLIPKKNAGMDGMVAHTTKFENTDEFSNFVKENIGKMSLKEFEDGMLNFLEPKYYFSISELEKLTVQVGWWVFGGMRLRVKGGELQVLNVQPKSVRAAVKQFYNL